MKNIFNGHAYLLASRAGNVFMDEKPVDLYNLIKECFVQKNGSPAISTFSKGNYVSEAERNKMQFSNRCGLYTTKMVIPDKFKNEKKNARFLNT